jgi:hypothetical protein
MVKHWTDDRYYALCTVLHQNANYYNSKSSSPLDHHIQDLHVIEIRVHNGMLNMLRYHQTMMEHCHTHWKSYIKVSKHHRIVMLYVQFKPVSFIKGQICFFRDI